jgi:hypothetical protein
MIWLISVNGIFLEIHFYKRVSNKIGTRRIFLDGVGLIGLSWHNLFLGVQDEAQLYVGWRCHDHQVPAPLRREAFKCSTLGITLWSCLLSVCLSYQTHGSLPTFKHRCPLHYRFRWSFFVHFRGLHGFPLSHLRYILVPHPFPFIWPILHLFYY